jgi:methylmalonyl-CoA/ethylmalonyl-CoA epimerase
MKIHHIGYLVDDINDSAMEFIKLGFIKKGEIIEDTSRGIFILFLDNNEYVVELIQTLNTDSPIYGLRKRYRNSPYHICFQTENLKKAIEELEMGGYTLFQPPQQAPAITGCPNVAFLMNQKIGIIELVEIHKAI